MKVLKSSFEGEIVKHYDQFFLPSEKVYRECQYLLQMLKQYRPGFGLLMDVGCGTGAYSEEMSKYFKRVLGVDVSDDMISYAENNHSTVNTRYICSDIRSFDEIDNGCIDVAISLAHVIGYQLDNKSVNRYLRTVHNKLKDDGLFLFNFYNMPAIYSSPLNARHVKRKNEHAEITRISNATNNKEKGCLDLDYYYIIENHSNTEIDDTSVVEIHEQMRYFTKCEIELFLNKNGFTAESFFNYGTDIDLTSDEWNAGCLARKLT